MQRQTAAIIGVGALEGLGAAVARRFAREGFHVIVAGRTAARIDRVVQVIGEEGHHAEAALMDATSEKDVVALFDHAMTSSVERAPLSVVVFNAGNNLYIPFRDLSAEAIEEFWRVGCFSGFLVGREAARRLAPLGRGTILFTGASGSMRGKPGYAHFAAAKAGLRMLSQSREAPGRRNSTCVLIRKRSSSSVIPDHRNPAKLIAVDRHTSDGWERQMGSHHQRAALRHLLEQANANACCLVWVMLEAVEPIRVIEGDGEHRIAGECQSLTTRSEIDHAMPRRMSACTAGDHARRHFIRFVECPDQVAVFVREALGGRAKDGRHRRRHGCVGEIGRLPECDLGSGHVDTNVRTQTLLYAVDEQTTHVIHMHVGNDHVGH